MSLIWFQCPQSPYSLLAPSPQPLSGPLPSLNSSQASFYLLPFPCLSREIMSCVCSSTLVKMGVYSLPGRVVG